MPGINELIRKRNWQGAQRNVSMRHQQALLDYPRIPTGIFPVDFALAGGLPCNVITQFYGPQRGGKSSLSYLTGRSVSKTCMRCLQPIALCACPEPRYELHCAKCGKVESECSCKDGPKELRERCVECGKNRIDCECKSRLEQKTFLVQFEGTAPDSLYFATLGYDNEHEMIVVEPDYGEQGCDMIEAAAQADDCGLIIVDSLAGVVPRTELESGYDDQQVALQARLIAKLFRRLTNVLVKEYRRGHLMSVIFINQMRTVIGGGNFGPSETTPGGWASKHGYRLSMRVNQLSPDRDKGEVDKATDMQNVLRFSTSLLGPQSKQQMLILAAKAEYKVTVTEFKGYPSGSILDAQSAITKARELGILDKMGDEYRLQGTDMSFRRLADIEAVFQSGEYEGVHGMDDVFRHKVVQTAKRRAVNRIMEQYRRRVQVIANPNQE